MEIVQDMEKLQVTNNINDYLNNDCLINIFEYLSIDDKLNIELVCKRWQTVGKLSWSKVKSFDIGQIIFEFEQFDNIESYIVNVLKRSGPYINNLNIYVVSHIDYEKIIEEVSNYCRNITNFKIDGGYCGTESLELLFQNNQKISSISLCTLGFDGAECLTSLNTDCITNLDLRSDFDGDTIHHVYDLLRKLKNLKIVKLLLNSGFYNTIKLIDSLNASNSENIHEFTLSYRNDCSPELVKLLGKQKKLYKLNLESFGGIQFLNFNLWNDLRECPLQEIAMVLNDKMSIGLNNFENLRIIECAVTDITDNIIKNLTKCKNLKKLDIVAYGNYYLTEIWENKFSDLQNLESFRFIRNYSDIDNILHALSRSNKNLRELDILFCTDEGLKSILLLENLTILKLNIDGLSDTMKFIDVINKLLNLKEVTIRQQSYFIQFDKTFYHKINEAKIKRGDKNVLKIFTNNQIKTNFEVLNKSLSLISVSNLNENE